MRIDCESTDDGYRIQLGIAGEVRAQHWRITESGAEQVGGDDFEEFVGGQEDPVSALRDLLTAIGALMKFVKEL